MIKGELIRTNAFEFDFIKLFQYYVYNHHHQQQQSSKKNSIHIFEEKGKFMFVYVFLAYPGWLRSNGLLFGWTDRIVRMCV